MILSAGPAPGGLYHGFSPKVCQHVTGGLNPPGPDERDMQVGVISDVHSNLVALEAVLADMGPVEELVCAGDVVG